eukprot:365813-Chlamydomonas_euryale.AAC.2
MRTRTHERVLLADGTFRWLTRRRAATSAGAARPVYPFTAIVGQEEMKLALILNVIDPKIGGVMVMGDRGTGKSTTIRALADLLPEMTVRDRKRGRRQTCNASPNLTACAGSYVGAARPDFGRPRSCFETPPRLYSLDSLPKP